MSKDFASLVAQAMAVRNHYDELNAQDGKPIWDAKDVMAGFVTDMGELNEHIMAKFNLRRPVPNLDEALAHELADCLWSLIVISEKLGVNLEAEFEKTMVSLHERIERQKLDRDSLS